MQALPSLDELDGLARGLGAYARGAARSDDVVVAMRVVRWLSEGTSPTEVLALERAAELAGLMQQEAERVAGGGGAREFLEGAAGVLRIMHDIGVADRADRMRGVILSVAGTPDISLAESGTRRRRPGV